MNAKYSIKELEKLSGIKAHTLRIWEQRYGILKPERTDTNIRWYCNDELKTLLNISLLNNHGIKISKIAQLSEKQIIEEVNKIVEIDCVEKEIVDGLVISMVEIDEQRFEKIISNCILKKGFSTTYEKVIYPFLNKIGIMWQTGCINPAQEHFISNLIRQKLITAIDGVIPAENKKAQRFVLFLPDGELHELSLLYFSYLLKSKGHQIIYLGQSVPLDDLKKIVAIRKPQYLISVFTNPNTSTEELGKEIALLFTNQTILLSGFQLTDKKIKFPSNTKIFKTPEDLLSILP